MLCSERVYGPLNRHKLCFQIGVHDLGFQHYLYIKLMLLKHLDVLSRLYYIILAFSLFFFNSILQNYYLILSFTKPKNYNYCAFKVLAKIFYLLEPQVRIRKDFVSANQNRKQINWTTITM